MKNLILLIDPQNDFTHVDGSLYVHGAEDAVFKMQDLLYDFADKENTDILVTLDSHREMHISHPCFWRDSDGNMPEPCTHITLKDYLDKKWRAVVWDLWAETYLRTVEDKGMEHIIWPEHCIINSWGWDVNNIVMHALTDTESRRYHSTALCLKGDNTFTDSFSAISPIATVPYFPDTEPNLKLLDFFERYDKIYIGGFCADICAKETIRDIVKYRPSLIPKLCVITDCTATFDARFKFDTDEVYKEIKEGGAVIDLFENFDLLPEGPYTLHITKKPTRKPTPFRGGMNCKRNG